MLRLDKYLCDMKLGSRSNIKEHIKKGHIAVNGITIKKPEYKVDYTDIIEFDGQRIIYQEFFYYMLNKPAGYVSATNDEKDKTVMELLGSDLREDLFPIGRLDKDTEGLLLISNDGELAHNLLSPKKHVEKCYFVRLDQPIDEKQIKLIEDGIDIGDDKITKTSKITDVCGNELTICITEGRYHQVKRMFQAVGRKVIFLKRVSMGPVSLDSLLKTGEYRPLSEKEIESLKNTQKGN